MKTLSFLLLLSLTACAISKDPQHVAIRHLHKAHAEDDTGYVYALPYPAGETHLMVQGYYSRFSHQNRAAIDFKMKRGSTVAAARDGVVVRTQSTNNRGGLNRKYRTFANFIVIEHSDGSRAGYWHLQQNGVLVSVGDTVKQGQAIGYSGKTGYSAFPHLHFMVWSTSGGSWQQIPTRFHTGKGAVYLAPMHRYKSVAPPIVKDDMAAAEE